MRSRGTLLASALAAAAGVVFVAGPVAHPTATAAQTTSTDRATGLRIAVVLINFTDSAIDSSAAYRAKVGDIYFGPNSLASYYREASDDRITFVPLAGRPQVLGPWTVNMAAACDSGGMADATKAELTEQGINAADYDYLSIWFPNAKAGCQWGGLGQQPGRTTWMPDFGTLSGVVHEVGHNQGYRHLPSVRCTAGTLANCVEAGYQGSSPMGSGGAQTGLAASELLHSGWVNPGQLVTAPQPGMHTLVPLHAPASVTGPRVLKVTRSGTNRMLVSYRRNGNTIDTGAGEGVQLHLSTEGAFHTATLVDPSASTTGQADTDLNPGASVTDAASGITVKTETVTATQATVRLSWTGRYLGPGGKCLDVNGGSSAEGTTVQLWTCHTGTAQRWARTGDGTIRALGKCLDTSAGKVQIHTCNGAASQQWVPGAGDTLRNPQTSQCLAAAGGATTDGTGAVLTRCDGSTAQRWTSMGTA